MSIIRHTPISLTDVIKDSNLIVEVQCAGPFREEIPVKDRSGKAPAPPFIKKGFIFNVQKVLKNTTTTSTIPETIQVPDENWRRFLSQHNEQYAGASGRSYHVREYETDVPSVEEAKILFLNYFQDMYDFTAKDSFESMDALEKIEKLMAAKQR
jgi:hypothetical protein